MSKMAAPQRIGRKEGFGYMCMCYGVLIVCSSTVVQYNSVTRPPLSAMHRLSEVGCGCPVLVLCLCFRSSKCRGRCHLLLV